jgi:dienelactone hydrolase
LGIERPLSIHPARATRKARTSPYEAAFRLYLSRAELPLLFDIDPDKLMRTLEFGLLALVAATLLSPRCVPTRWAGVTLASFVALTVLMLAAHLAWEHGRWQMGPSYLVILCLVVDCARSWPSLPSPWLVGSGFILVLGSAALDLVFPVFDFPTPTGPFPIGCATYHLTDKDRVEPHGNPSGAARELMIQIWYPAARAGRAQTYRATPETEWKTRHLTFVKTHSSPGVAVSSASPRYPVVLYTGAWTGRRSHNLVQVEDLASHGFVVVGIDHPHGSSSVVFPDGRVIRTGLGEFLEGSTVEEVETSARIIEEELQIRTNDARFVLNELQRLDRHDPDGILTGRMDMNQVGIFGYSFGGAVAAELCRTDRRFLAGADLDGNIFGEALSRGIEQPFLFVYGSVAALPSRSTSVPALARNTCQNGDDLRRYIDNHDLRSVLRSLEEHGGYRLVLIGATHINFCDSVFYSPLQKWRGAGQIERYHAQRIISDHLHRFFRQFLLPESALQNGMLASQDAAARLEVWPKPHPTGVHAQVNPEP